VKIFAVNAGSSSLKFQILDMPAEKEITSGIVERIGNDNAVFTIKFAGQKFEKELPIKDHAVAVQLLFAALLEHHVLSSLDEIKGVGHRVVQGGEIYKDSALIDDKVIQDIKNLSDLAPLHNPANLIGIEAFKKALPNVPQVAVFDTTFHQTMPATNYMYSTPYSWYEKYGVRKYGAHGTSHQFVSERAATLLKNPQAKIIVCHLGNGASICAVDGGKSVDTSMGLTPLEGIPMGTRSGNVDPAVLGLIARKENKDIHQILDDLNKQSGYLGVSGVSHDSRDITDAIAHGNSRAKLALDVQLKRIADYIGSYFVVLGGLDAIVFTAGIGENAKDVREGIINRLSALGVKLDPELNKLRGEHLISAKDSKVKVFIIPTNEEVMIARDTMRVGKLG